MKKLNLTIDQILIITAAVIFLLGGVIMLVNVFAGQQWAFWVGIGMVVTASVLVVIGTMQLKKREENAQQSSPSIEEENLDS